MRSRLLLVSRILGYRSFRAVGRPRLLPVSVTVSVTNRCDSRCSTCFLWRFYSDHPELRGREFKVWEFARVFESLGGAPFWFTMSGGEPFLRADLPEICEAAVEHCRPGIINVPSNGLRPGVIEGLTRRILGRIGGTSLIVNLSLDGVGGRHDEIRGVPGNFERLLETYRRLKALKEDYPRLQVGIHSVVSRFNVDHLLEVYEFAKTLEPDSYITEVAEERSELFNLGKDITPDTDAYAGLVDELSRRIRSDYLRSPKGISRITQAFRLTYYRMAARVLREHRQVVPCYAGYASCQITPFGDVWPCCVLGYDRVMGNLREADYDFGKVWFSREADEIRRFVKGGGCACPLANAHYTSILCSFRAMAGVLVNMMR